MSSIEHSVGSSLTHQMTGVAGRLQLRRASFTDAAPTRQRVRRASFSAISNNNDSRPSQNALRWRGRTLASPAEVRCLRCPAQDWRAPSQVVTTFVRSPRRNSAEPWGGERRPLRNLPGGKERVGEARCHPHAPTPLMCVTRHEQLKLHDISSAPSPHGPSWRGARHSIPIGLARSREAACAINVGLMQEALTGSHTRLKTGLGCNPPHCQQSARVIVTSSLMCGAWSMALVSSAYFMRYF
jgi:hypothetical protein